MKNKTLSRWILGALLSVFSPLMFAQGFLHLDQTNQMYFVDGANARIQLRGMGLGGWLVPEGYMLGWLNAPGDSPTGFENKVTSVVSTPAAKDAFFALYRSTFVQRKDIDSLAHWGYNSLRLPFHYKILSPSQGVYNEAGFAIIDSLLAWCEADHLYLILDLHCAPGGQNTANISDYQGAPALWESTTLQAWTVSLWKEIARRYSTRTWIGGYDLLNETVWTFGNNNQILWKFFQTVTDSIRTVDKNHLVFWEGNNWATDFAGAPTTGLDGNMAWSFHKYWSQVTDISSVSGMVSLRSSSNRAVWMGESGENTNQWFAEAISMFENNKFGWSWWTLKKINQVSAPLSVKFAPNYATVVNYWNNGGTKPSTSFAEAALMEQAALFDAAKCTYHPDFNDAIFRMSKTTARIPFAQNTIPGVIYPVNYDMGRQGYAYFDADFEANSQGAATNQGGAYRNDGVDIETCADALSNGYDVGWTAAGEWMAYTVQVAQSGTYDISIRSAASGTGATVSLDVDSAPLTGSFALPNTGGWQTWKTSDMGNYQLTAGTHTLVLHLNAAGSNLNRLEFTLVATGINDEPSAAPQKFGLNQNFPNPFNPTTDITFVARSNGQARLSVYSILGEEVAIPFDARAEAGRAYRVRFDASRLASGMYIYTLREGAVTESKSMMLLR